MPDGHRSDVLEVAGYFMSILGAMTLGISVGMGLLSYLTQRRFRCGTGIGHPSETVLVNITDACADVIGSAEPMIIASACGGAVAFLSGMAVMVYVKRGGAGD